MFAGRLYGLSLSIVFVLFWKKINKYLTAECGLFNLVCWMVLINIYMFLCKEYIYILALVSVEMGNWFILFSLKK